MRHENPFSSVREAADGGPGGVRSGAVPLSLAVLTCFLLLSVPLPAATPAAGPYEAPVRLENIAPLETVFFFQCSGLEGLKEKMAGLDLHALWMEEEVQAFAADAKAALESMAAQQEQGREREEEALLLRKVWSLFKKPVAVAVSSRTTLFDKGLALSTAFALDMGSDRAAFLGTVEELIRGVAARKKMEESAFEYRGIEIRSLRRPRRRGALCRAVAGNLFLVTLNRYFMQELIDHYLDRTPALSQLPAFRRTRARVGGAQTDLFAFLNLEPFLRVLRPIAPYEAEEWASLLGVEGIDALGFGSVLDQGVSRDSFFIHCPGEKHGLLGAFAPRPLDRSAARFAPPNAVYFADGVFDPERLLHEVDRFVREAVPEGYAEFRKGIDTFRSRTGVDLEKGLLAPLGDEICLVVGFPEAGGPGSLIPEVILLVKLDDTTAFEAAIDKLLARARGVEVAETPFEDGTIRYLRLAGGDLPIAPAFTMEGDRLVAATSPLVLKKYLRWLHGGTPGLAANERFRKAIARVPEGAAVVKYLDFRRLVEMGYNLASPFLPALLSQSKLPLDAGLLPMTETLARHVDAATAYFLVDEEGVFVSARSPLGLGALIAVTAGVADWAVEKGLVPGTGRRLREKGKAAKRIEGRRSTGAGRTEADVARDLMAEGQYGVAEQLLGAWLEKHGAEGRFAAQAFMDRGYCRMKLKRFQDAMEDFQKAADLGPKLRAPALYNQACAAARAGNEDLALDLLEGAVEAGWKDGDHMAVDEDLAGLREDPRFQALLQRLKGGGTP